MNLRNAAVATLSVAFLAHPLGALAANFNYYTPPKIKVRGNSTTPIAGNGTVVVKVLVAKSGAAKSYSVIRSTNHGNDAAALEIAKSSSYVPATKGTTRQDAFYDYTLKFTPKGVASGGDPQSTAGVGKYKMMIRAGNYAGAQAGLKTYVAEHPADADAQLQLGIASEYLNDPSGAVAAFDKAGTVPANYQSVVVRAYVDAAGAAYQAKQYPESIQYAKKAVALSPGPFTYNALGAAEDAAGQSAAAVGDLETARKLAASDATMKAPERAKILTNLVSAYLDAGQPDKAKAVADEAAKIDPSNATGQTFFAQYYIRQATDLQSKAKYDDAATLLEKAAASAPAAQMPDLYAQAALALLKIKDKTPNDRAKADADKALAAAPDNALANFAAGISLANEAKSKDALVYLNKADASAKSANNTDLAAAVENVIKQLNQTK